MASDREGDASTVGCFLITAPLASCLAVFLALTHKEPVWLWILPIAGLLLWVVYGIHKEAVRPSDAEVQLRRLRAENTKLENDKSRLTEALSGFQETAAAENSVTSLFARERKQIEGAKRDFERIKASLDDRDDELKSEMDSIEEFRTAAKAEIQAADAELHRLWETCWAEKSAGFPTLAEQFADAWIVTRRKDIDSLRSIAIKTEELRKRLGREIRELKASEIVHRNLVAYYERLFPMLAELRDGEVPTKEDLIKVDDGEADRRKGWLSEDEWNSLDEAGRSQLALDRYCARNKSKWEIGLEYERFCGYRLESQGWEVEYHGALEGLDDLGRDLIARKPGEILVVQCKYWSNSKMIHEKHVFQTFGTMVALRVEQANAGLNVAGCVATSTKLSDRARKFADLLGVKLKENDKLREFPRIKCNAKSKSGKVYHLPFDQMYDHVKIRPEQGDFYCATSQEAESHGFRRAMRWQGNP